MRIQDFFLIKNFINLVLNRFVIKLKDSHSLEKNFKTKQLNLQLGEKKVPNKKTNLENG